MQREVAAEPACVDESVARAAPAAFELAPATALARLPSADAASRARAAMAMQSAYGNRALARAVQLARAPKEDPATKGKWEKEGGAAGKALFDLISQELPYDKLTKLIKEKVASLAEAAVSEASLKSMGVEEGKGAVVALTGKNKIEVLTGKDPKWAEKVAEEWMKGDGKAFLEKAQKLAVSHPEITFKAIVAAAGAAIMGGAAAYFSGAVDPPMLEHKFELGKGFSITPGLDLPKFGAPLAGEGKLGAGYKSDSFEASTGIGYVYGKGWTSVKLDLGAPKTMGVGYEYSLDKDKGGLHAFKGSADILKEKLKLSVKGVMSETGKSDELSGELSGKAGGFDYKAAATWGLSENQLKGLTMHLGFKNSDETLSFLADLAYENKDAAATFKGSAALKATVGQWAVSLSGEGGWTEGAYVWGKGAATVTIPIAKDWSLLPTVGGGYGVAGSGGAGAPSWMVSGGVGLQKGNSPVIPTFMWNQPIGEGAGPGFGTVGVTIPLGGPDKKKK